MLDTDGRTLKKERKAFSFQRNASLKQCSILTLLHTSLSGEALA